ncbi:universal stress protein [Actinokineospora iranica]|uniref:Nucleotide-binding universal stress protein, UspA family n=1 Tax=Actinokineospora iranica TaxID=1271860 RepID=A0A1G6SJK3_9PSEU|nr:universal stress protein [Actinokineospora iranica]SDD16973.1 Nucleotide-binding universal stress protein, UspA family [Actinokineospora iranica]
MAGKEKDGLALIVVGLDGGLPSKNASAWAAGLARREHAKLLLVYVEPLANPAYWTGVGMEGAAEAAVAYVAEMRRDAARYLDPVGVAWDVVHVRGDAARGLESVAERFEADCIVVGRSGRGGGRVGSVPKSLIADALRPIVVVP